MNLVDAVKSGKSFKRKNDPGWDDDLYWTIDDLESAHNNCDLSLEDILADDWEVQETKLSFTAQEIREAIIKSSNAVRGRQDCDWIEEIIKELGFNE